MGAINYDGKWCLGGLKKQACPAEMWLPNHNNPAKETRRREENAPIEFSKPGLIQSIDRSFEDGSAEID